MFTKVVNGFLPALFKRWVAVKARHLVSIVLFTRVEYDTGLTSQLDIEALDSMYHTGIQVDGARKPYKDFYRVVVSEMASGEWTTILHTLKREFRFFRKEISMHRLDTVVKYTPVSDEVGMGSVPGTRIEAEPTLAIHGNVLEAINLASTQFSHDYIDRDLVRTGISVVLITPGPGLFEVDYETLRTTTETLIGSGIGIDLVCMPKIPLHSVPLFRYRNPQFTEYQENVRMRANGSGSSTPRQSGPIFGSFSTLQESFSPSKSYNHESSHRPSILIPHKTPEEWSFAIPHWLDVSFWTGASQDLLSRPGAHTEIGEKNRQFVIQRAKEFAVRCKMYELEMSSIANDAMIEISVAPLSTDLQYQNNSTELLESPITESKNIPCSKKHASLSELVLGPVRWALDKNCPQSERDLFVVLDTYDESKSVHQKVGLVKGESKKQVKIRSEKAVKKMLADDSEVFGTSYNEGNEGPRGLSLVGAAIIANKKDSDSLETGMKPRKDSISSSISKSSTIFTPRPPKVSRQISLGKHGFGIAAPKAAVAELHTEHANAAKALSPITKGATSQTSSSAMGHLLSSPRQEGKGERPASSQGSLRSTKDSIHSSDPLSNEGDKMPSRPIAIKSPLQGLEAPGQHKSRSMLGSVYEVPSGTEEAELPTLQKLKSSDSLKTSKSKLLAGPTSALPTTLSPTTALSPWLNVLNPSNPTASDNIASQYKRWQHVFPRPLETKAMKWKSLSAPASVPLTTEFFPTRHQLNTEYHQKTYNISQYADEELSEEPKIRDDFFRELISLRLSQGFQIVIGSAVADAFGQKLLKIANAFDGDHIADDGSSIFMSMGNSIHQLSCVNGTDVEVSLFTRKSTTENKESVENAVTPYRPAVRTTLATTYETRQIMFSLGSLKDELDWNLVDSFIAGHDEEMSESLRFWRARFVLIPVQQSSINHRPGGGDSEEEIRLEGIRALTQLWQRHRYVAPSELQFPNAPNIPARKKRVANPLDIVYQTQDPSVVVNAELETLPLLETGEAHVRRGQLLSDSEPFRKSSLKIAELAEAIQAPVEKGGVRMQNRRWHFRLHYNCFIGSDMTTWLIENFDDIESREDAVELGNMLMAKDEEKRTRERELAKESGKEPEKDIGIFVHVEKRHPFRDGQYFYQVVGEFAKPRPETRGAWPFSNRRRDTSVPSTPMTETAMRDSPKPERAQSRSNDDEKTSSSGTATPTRAASARMPKVALSKVMKYDVDPRKRSYRPERINLHYDRLHNPDNCYHIRIDWLTVTPKLIEDAIQSWAITAERYGLRLIELPIAEASTITSTHPFRSPYLVHLASPPPSKQPETYFDASSLGPQVSPTRHIYQKALLKKHDFVLDIEAAQNFPSNVEVVYSWGRPDYKYSQYIHRSGVVLAQITDDGDFLLLANKLYNNRTIGAAEHRLIRPPDRERLHPQPSPISSPVVRPYSNANSHAYNAYVSSPSLRAVGAGIAADVLGSSLASSRLATLITPESIKDELEQFCSNETLLKAFYTEVLERGTPPPATPPSLRGSGAHLDGYGYGAGGMMRLGDIPTLGLPPGILSRTEGNSGSGSPVPGLRFGGVPVRRGTQHSGDGLSENDSPRGSVSGAG